jgi:hypothetical protein
MNTTPMNIAALALVLFAAAVSSAEDNRRRGDYGEYPSPNKIFTVSFWTEGTADHLEIREARLRRGTDRDMEISLRRTATSVGVGCS